MPTSYPGYLLLGSEILFLISLPKSKYPGYEVDDMPKIVYKYELIRYAYYSR